MSSLNFYLFFVKCTIGKRGLPLEFLLKTDLRLLYLGIIDETDLLLTKSVTRVVTLCKLFSKMTGMARFGKEALQNNNNTLTKSPLLYLCFFLRYLCCYGSF